MVTMQESLDEIIGLVREVGSLNERVRFAEIRHDRAMRGEKREPASELRARKAELRSAEERVAHARARFLSRYGDAA